MPGYLVLMLLHFCLERCLPIVHRRRIFPSRPFIVSRDMPYRLVVLYVSSYKGARISAHSLAAFTIPSMHLLSFCLLSLDIVELEAMPFVFFRVDLKLLIHARTADCKLKHSPNRITLTLPLAGGISPSLCNPHNTLVFLYRSFCSTSSALPPFERETWLQSRHVCAFSCYR
jgi:hypothetical protein